MTAGSLQRVGSSILQSMGAINRLWFGVSYVHSGRYCDRLYNTDACRVAQGRCIVAARPWARPCADHTQSVEHMEKAMPTYVLTGHIYNKTVIKHYAVSGVPAPTLPAPKVSALRKAAHPRHGAAFHAYGDAVLGNGLRIRLAGNRRGRPGASPTPMQDGWYLTERGNRQRFSASG